MYQRRSGGCGINVHALKKRVLGVRVVELDVLGAELVGALLDREVVADGSAEAFGLGTGEGGVVLERGEGGVDEGGEGREGEGGEGADLFARAEKSARKRGRETVKENEPRHHGLKNHVARPRRLDRRGRRNLRRSRRTP